MSEPKIGSMRLFSVVTRAMDMEHSDPPSFPLIERGGFGTLAGYHDTTPFGPVDWFLDEVLQRSKR